MHACGKRPHFLTVCHERGETEETRWCVAVGLLFGLLFGSIGNVGLVS
jgi:hypothetical protein